MGKELDTVRPAHRSLRTVHCTSHDKAAAITPSPAPPYRGDGRVCGCVGLNWEAEGKEGLAYPSPVPGVAPATTPRYYKPKLHPRDTWEHTCVCVCVCDR